jgi:integrase
VPRKSKVIISTDRQVATAKGPPEGRVCSEYRVAGTPNLVLRVTRSGHRSWTYWVKRLKTGRYQKLNLGPYPAVTLARARDEALRARRAIVDGIDPFDLRDSGRGVLAFRVLGETYIARYAKPKKRSWAEDERKLVRDVYPVLGVARADLVTKPDVVRLLDGIVDRGAPIAANRTLAVIRKVFNWAVAEGYVTTSPASGIPMRAKENVRRRTLSEAEIFALWQALDDLRGFESVTADTLKLQLLLGARVREITDMRRSEITLDPAQPMWILPSKRAKAGRDVLRPLPPLARNIIQQRLKTAGTSEFVFTSPADPRKPITSHAPTRAIHRAADRGLVPAGFTPHDLRRTCRTFWAKLGIGETVAKKILGHAPPRSDVTASVYDQYTYLPEMRDALAKWEKCVMTIVAAKPQMDIAA